MNQDYEVVVNSLFSDNSIASILRGSEPCFIKQYMSDFSYASTTTINPLGWNAFICLNDKDPDALTSKLHSGGYSFPNLRRIKNIDKGNLVPKIRLYKVFVDANSRKPVREVPISFPSSNKENITSLLSNRSERGDDIGIKSFTFDVKNQNPFAASRIVESTLVLSMASGESLMKPRKSGFKFADLIIRNNRVDPKDFDSDFYQIKAVIGYEIPSSELSISPLLKNDLRYNQMSMIMNLIDYDISFEQNGFLTLTLNYVSRIEQQFQSASKYNIFEDKEYEKGSKAKRANLRSKIRGAKTNKSNLSTQLQTAISKAEARHTKAISSIPKPGETYTLSQIGGYVLVGQDIDEELTMTEDTYYLQVRNANAKKEEQIEQAHQQFANKIATADAEISAVETDLIYAQNQNRVEKYSQMLDRLFIFGKVRKLVIPKDALLIYGDTFQQEIEAHTQEMFDRGSNVIEIQQFAQFVSDRRAVISIDVKNQIINGEPVRSAAVANLQQTLDDIAQQIAAADGRSQVLAADILEANRQFDPAIFAQEQVRSGQGTTYTNNRADSNVSYHDDKIIYYFYLGDLIEQAMALNATTEKLFDDKLALALGNFQFTTVVPTLSTAPGTTGTSPYKAKEVRKSMNIADVPITTEMFLRFFKSNISGKSLDVYPMASFIRDIMQRLVMPSINSECFGNATDEPKVMKTTTFELPEVSRHAQLHAIGVTKEPMTGGVYGNRTVRDMANYYENMFGPPVHQGMRVNVNDIMLNNTQGSQVVGDKSLLSRTKSSERYGYLLTYVVSRGEDLQFEGSEAEDAKKGIYHFYLGSDRGLVKNIEFQKQANPLIALTMAERAMVKGDEKIELWRNFAARLSLIGNTLLYPGSFIYINPSISGLGSPTDSNSLGRAMGLGGYYMVLRVSNTITESGWGTDVEAVWQSAPPSAAPLNQTANKGTPSAKPATQSTSYGPPAGP
jgi:hypothetical protein